MQTLALGVAILLSPVADDAVTVTARVEAGVRGSDIVLDIEYADGWTGSKAGIPAPILQIDAPPSVKLNGKVLTKYRDLARNEFLHEPFERLIKTTPARIGFTIDGDPNPNQPIGLNVLIYVRGDTETSASFVRRRLELSPKLGSVAKVVPASTSAWGRDGGLQIGDKAEPFSLPRADGSTVSLGDYLGQKNILVTTYRAYW